MEGLIIDYFLPLFVFHATTHSHWLSSCSSSSFRSVNALVCGPFVLGSILLYPAHESPNGKNELLVRACRHGAVRELYEETGIDLRQQLDRVQPARIRSDAATGEGVSLLPVVPVPIHPTPRYHYPTSTSTDCSTSLWLTIKILPRQKGCHPNILPPLVI